METADSPVIAPPPMVLAEPRPTGGEYSARLIDLKGELKDLRAELDDATLAGPIIKLVGSGAATVGGIVFLSLAQTASTQELRSNDTTFGVIFAGVAVGLAIWGGIQLALRLRTRAVLPPKIENIEREIYAIGR